MLYYYVFNIILHLLLFYYNNNLKSIRISLSEIFFIFLTFHYY